MAETPSAPGDEEATIRRDILPLSSGLHSTVPSQASDSLSTPEVRKKPHSPVNLTDAIVSLLSTGTTLGAPEEERDPGGNRVIAATIAPNEAGRVEAFILTRNPNVASNGSDNGRNRIQPLRGDQRELSEMLYPGACESAYVGWEQHAQDVFSTFNAWSKSSLDREMKRLAFHMFFLRRYYPKIVARMRTAECIWGKHPRAVLHECTEHLGTKNEVHEISVPDRSDRSETKSVHCWLQSHGLQPTANGKFVLQSSISNVWTRILKEEYDALNGSDDFEDETVEDLRVHNRLERCVKALVSIIPCMKQVISFLESRPETTFEACLILSSSPPVQTYKPESIELIINDLRSTLLSEDAKEYMLYGSKVAMYSDKSTMEESQCTATRARWKNRNLLLPIEKKAKIDRLSQVNAFISKGTAHCEAAVMSAVYTSSVNDNREKPIPRLSTTQEIPIGMGKGCCWVCWRLHLHLNAVIQSRLIVLSGMHGIVYTWVAPPGLPLDVLRKLRADLTGALDIASKEARAVVTSVQSTIHGDADTGSPPPDLTLDDVFPKFPNKEKTSLGVFKLQE